MSALLSLIGRIGVRAAVWDSFGVVAFGAGLWALALILHGFGWA